MIFVTVGTHEQPFDRLVEKIDQLKGNHVIEDDVVIQSGYSNYQPKYCKSFPFLPYDEMEQYVKEAKIVITHGGPSSFIMPLQLHKVPVVVPRQKQFNEHVNNHQVDFCNAVKERQKNILVVEDIDQLEQILNQYDEIVSRMNITTVNHNKLFNEAFEKEIEKLF